MSSLTPSNATNAPPAKLSRGCFPGSFNPFTIAHLAIVESTIKVCGLESLTLLLSEHALGKNPNEQEAAIVRARTIIAACRHLPQVRASTTRKQLLADLASGYDLIVMGADKWWQIHEERWYTSAAEKQLALASLPFVVVVPRDGSNRTPTNSSGFGDTSNMRADDLHAFDHPAGFMILDLGDPKLREVSSTGVRDGKTEWRA
jgi:nicotinic acid mononucleotide adenylyltransferase